MADRSVSRLGIVSTTLKSLLKGLARLFVSPFKGANGAPTYYKDVVYSMMRAQLGSLSPAQVRYVSSTTTAVYLKWAKEHGITPKSITLSSGVQAHWVGSSEAKKVILYFHGGGFLMPATPAHFSYFRDISASVPDTSALFLAYDLTPNHTYPTQLRQCVESLRYLVEKTGRSPSHITLGGDSAGGNLVLGVLSHVAHPHPEIHPLRLPTKLHAALLLSPWVSFDVHVPSFTSNAEKDSFDGRALVRWTAAFLGTEPPFAGDFYNEAAKAPADWWEGVADVVDEVLIWAGGNEVLLDSIEELARRFTQGFGGKGGKVTTIITPKAAHIEMMLEMLIGYKGDSGTGSTKVIKEWAQAKL